MQGGGEQEDAEGAGSSRLGQNWMMSVWATRRCSLGDASQVTDDEELKKGSGLGIYRGRRCGADSHVTHKEPEESSGPWNLQCKAYVLTFVIYVVCCASAAAAWRRGSSR